MKIKTTKDRFTSATCESCKETVKEGFCKCRVMEVRLEKSSVVVAEVKDYEFTMSYNR